MSLQLVDEEKEIIKSFYNMLKIKFEYLIEWENKNLLDDKKKRMMQERVILFDLSFIFRFMFGKTIRNDLYDKYRYHTNIRFNFTEFLNVIAHYKRFFDSKVKCKSTFYFYITKNLDDQTRSERTVFNWFSYLTRNIKDMHVISMYNDSMQWSMMKIINSNIINRGLISNKLERNVNLALYSFTKNRLANYLIYSHTDLDLINPMTVVYYQHGKVFMNTIEDYCGEGYKILFNAYREKIEKCKFLSNNSLLPKKPPLEILLLDYSYKRLTFGKMNEFVEKYKKGEVFKNLDYDTEERIFSYTIPLEHEEEAIELMNNNLKIKTLLSNKEIYHIKDFVGEENDVKIEWLIKNYEDFNLGV